MDLDHPGLILLFVAIILFGLILDLGLLNRSSKQITNANALGWSVFWIGISMAFSIFVYFNLGSEKFYQFQSAYWIEKSLSIDNLFVFILVFKFFKIDPKNEHSVLFWGIIGALIFRAIFIYGGVEIVRFGYLPPFTLGSLEIQANIVLTTFGLILIYAGINAVFTNDEDKKEFGKGWIVRQLRKIVPISNNYYGDRFFIRYKKYLFATKLLLVLIVIETTDLVFAMDSIPAIFSIAPNDSFILYSSNIFAILGLRSLYFLLSNTMHYFHLLKYGLAFVLTFIGFKMIIEPIFHIESMISLFVVLGVLMTSVISSLLIKPRN